MDVDQLVEAVDPARSVTVEIPDVETIIERASSGRSLLSGSRSWTARSRPAAWAWVAVVAVLALVLVFGFRVGFTSKTNAISPGRPLPVSVDIAATPRGWVPVDYGDAQVSVPSSWVVSVDGGCPSTKLGKVFLFGPTGDQVSCGSTPQGNSVSFGPSKARGTRKATVVNGIKVYSFGGGADALEQGSAWAVPSLGIELTLTGPLSTRVLHTLTYSPRSVALASGSAPPIPSSWHRVSFGGLSLEAPTNWPVRTASSLGRCRPTNLTLLFPSAVVFDTGAVNASSGSCLSTPSEVQVDQAAPTNGLIIDPGPYGPTAADSSVGECLHINGLSACPTTSDIYGVLVLAVHVPGSNQPVAVEIGLAGDGMAARTILYSMRVSVPNPTVSPTTSATAKPVQTPAAATCAAAQLAATATRESGAASHMGIVVAFRNTATECSLDGYPTAWFVDAAGRRLGDVSVRGGSTASPVLLPHSGLASTTVWTADPGMVAGGSVGATCHPETAAGIDLTLPGQSAVVFAPLLVSVCTTDPALPWTTPIVSGTQERTS